MASILSFDNRSLTHLLGDQFESLFSAKYPIFYKNKLDKGNIDKGRKYYKNALDTALKFD